MQQTATDSVTKNIVKRDGRIAEYDVHKIADAIFRAAESVGGSDFELALSLAILIETQLIKIYKNTTPTVENVQDLVEKTLIEKGHAKTAKAYILYRHKKKEERQKRVFILGKDNSGDNLQFTNAALKIYF